MTELRQLTLEDTIAQSKLMAEAFAGGRRPTPPAEGEPDDIVTNVVWGIFENTRLVASATVHDLHLTWEGSEAPLGGVAGVACAADQRGRGHVARLLSHALAMMRESGQYLSGLYPFSWAFYRKHGWEWVGEKRRYTVPTAPLLSAATGRSIEMVEGADALEIVRPIYDEFARRYRGMTTRRDPSPDWWKRVLGDHDNRATYVHVHRDPASGAADGYLTFRYGKEEVGSVGDFFANTPAAYEGLLSVLHYYGTQVERITWSAPTDDPLPLHVMDWDLETKVLPLFMGRIVDIKAALTALLPLSLLEGRLVVQVTDPTCDWNSGAFAVGVESGHVVPERTTAAAGVTLDIQTLTQAYWGQPSLDMLRRAGRVAVADEAQFRLLSALLPPAVCYLQDGF